MAEWEEYNKIDPIGEWRNDHRLAMLSSLLSNLTIQVHGKKGTKLTKIEDFLVEWDSALVEEKKQQSPEDMKKFLMDLAARQNKGAEKTRKRQVKDK